MTDSLIDDIVSLAKDDPSDNGKTEELGSKAKTAHAEVVAQEEQRKAEEEAARKAAEEQAKAERHRATMTENASNFLLYLYSGNDDYSSSNF